MATLAGPGILQLPRMALLYIMECLEISDAMAAGLCCKTLQENGSYDWLWRQYYNRRWLFSGRAAINKEAYIRRHLTDRGMEEGKASQYSVTSMRAGTIINAVQVLGQDVIAGYDDGQVLIWDASTGGRIPKSMLATLSEGITSLWLHRQSYLIAVTTSTVMAWEVVDNGYRHVWEHRFGSSISSVHLTDNTEHMLIGFESAVARLVRISSGTCTEIAHPRAARLSSVFIEAEPAESYDTPSARPITAFACGSPTQISVFKFHGEDDFSLLPDPPLPGGSLGGQFRHCELMVTNSNMTLLSTASDGSWYTATLSVGPTRQAWRVDHRCAGRRNCRVVCVKRQGHFLAMGTDQGQTYIYSLNSGTLVHTLAEHSGVVTAICLDQNKCLTGGSDKCMKVWKLQGQQPQALYALLGGSRTTNGRDHPQRPGCSAIILDADRVVAAFGGVLRVYSFAV